MIELNMAKNNFAGRCIAAGCMATALGIANAQNPSPSERDSATEVAAMVVTGSVIPQSEVATSLPVSTYTEENIRKTGATTITQFLQTIPQNSGARFRETVSTGLSFSPGAAAVALRGLSVNATLVLLNGRRIAPFALAQNGTDSFVDINSIPLAAVDRIEILREGASAIYGSDSWNRSISIYPFCRRRGTSLARTRLNLRARCTPMSMGSSSAMASAAPSSCPASGAEFPIR